MKRAKIKNKKPFGMAALKDQPEQFKPGRRCKLCKKPLTVFNAGAECFSHSVTRIEKIW